MADHFKASHEFFMAKCIELAQVARHRGESPVGTIIVKNEQMIAEGIEGVKTNKDITYHAEIEAIRQAIKKLDNPDLSGCIMYTTHEPCIMCSYVIRHHKITTIIIGLTTGEQGGYSSALPLLLDSTITKWGDPPKIITGILENECRKMELNKK